MAFQAIRLDSGEGLSATFVPGAGMVVISLTFDGEEFLDQRKGLSSYVESASTMGIPILYPWANRLASDSWEFRSRPVRISPESEHIKRDQNGLAIHGTLAASDLWKVEQASTSEDLGSATIRASLNFGEYPELLDTFPFPHLLELEFSLAGATLRVKTTVTPSGDIAVPLAYGFHPYLRLPASRRSKWAVSMPEMLSVETDSRQIPTGRTTRVEAIEGRLEERDMDDAYAGLDEGARFSVADRQHRIEVCFDQGFRAAQIYSPARENFICFEPMKAPTNALRSGFGLPSVEPGGIDVSEFSISLGQAERPVVS